MPWKECHVVDERLRFIARLHDGEQMVRLCAEVGVADRRRIDLEDSPMSPISPEARSAPRPGFASERRGRRSRPEAY